MLIPEISLRWGQHNWTAQPLDGHMLEQNKGTGKGNSEKRIPIVKMHADVADAVVVLVFYTRQMFPSFFSDCRERGKTQFSFF